MHSVPKLSVLIPVYGPQSHFTQSLSSILSQNYRDFEVLILAEGNTSQAKKETQALQDSRVRWLEPLPEPGLIAALNYGIDQARGEYIARMDADDISHPKRFERQLRILESDTEIGLVGCYAQVITDDPTMSSALLRPPRGPKDIASHLLFENTFVHPSIMGRTMLFRHLKYDPAVAYAEDWDLWSRAVRSGYKLVNLPEVLFSYRWHKENASHRHKDQTRAAWTKIRTRWLESLSIPIHDETIRAMELLEASLLKSYPWTKQEITILDAFLEELLQKSTIPKFLSERNLKTCIGRKILIKMILEPKILPALWSLNRKFKLPLRESLLLEWKRRF